MRQKTFYGIYRRFLAGLLCFCMVMSTVSGVGVLTALTADAADGTAAAQPGPTQHILEGTRVADPDTMDDYLERLLTDANGSRYAGRVWTDKTVFAYGDSARKAGSHFNGKDTITLNMGTDGYDGNVTFNADFAHVFSALSSSQVVNEYPPSPVDLVIVFDMSGSMGQDTRYGIDPGLNTYVKAQDPTYPEAGVYMADRIANSRIQKTLDAINDTIDKLMEQNPQNRVAVCGYGANAVVLMPLGHYKKVNESTPYLSVGGMETLYHPSDLVYRVADDTVGDIKVEKSGWYWQNNRDTCYTVVVNAMGNNYTGILDSDGDAPDTVSSIGSHWEKIQKTVSNNVRTDDGTPVKAFPGQENWVNGNPTDTNGELSRDVYKNTSSGEKGWAAGLQGIIGSMYPNPNKPDEMLYLWDQDLNSATSNIKLAMKPTKGLKADDYVGYFTNTQGGIYLAYKQLADSEATTYTETLTNGVVSTVARIPAAIIMSDGGANFSFNEMGQEGLPYTAEDWNARYGQRVWESNALQRDYLKANAWTSNHTPNWNANHGKTKDGKRDLTEGRYKDVRHLLGGATEDSDSGPVAVQQKGDEWYNVFIPGKDTLGEEWDGLHGIYNQGADIYEDGTLSSPPVWDQPGVFYSSDNDVTGTAGTVMEVLLTASYMSSVVKKHYSNGWTKNNATEGSKSDLFTYTMNVDTVHVPLWGRMRLYPTLDPKEYNLNDIETWYNDSKNNDKFGTDEQIQSSVYYDSLKKDKAITKKLLFEGGTIPDLGQIGEQADEPHNPIMDDGPNNITGLKQAWEAFQKGNRTEGPNEIGGNGAPVNIAIQPIPTGGVTYKAGDGDNIKVENYDVITNIAYNDGFYDVTTADLSNTFDEILTLILGKVFVPVSGDNDAGVGDSITYQDPIGQYMEVKNGSITATPYHTDNSITDPKPTDYDMALLLFGEMHGLVRTGVYDWDWNDKYMNAHPDAGTAGKEAFPGGWVKANADPATANLITEKAYPEDCSSSDDAWSKGYIYRIGFDDLIDFVPIIGTDGKTATPETLPAQVKNTVYTIYRFACTAEDRNQLRRNPVYGDVPKELIDKWQPGADGSYPDTNEIYKDTPGVYRLSDIRVWVEDTGDFVDTDGAITPNSGYDRSLYVNVPAAAVPTQLATVTLGRDGVLSYETNLGSDHDSEEKDTRYTEALYQNYCRQSTPLRLFYAVGLEEDLIIRDADGKQIGVDVSAISEEYIAEHSDENTNIEFISNFYSNTAYDSYVTDSADSRTRGDPTVTFSPGEDNRYYVFQKPLPLYAHAYRVNGDSLTPVDRTGGETFGKNKEGNGNTTWENYNVTPQRAGSWIGGRYMGVYKDKADFEAKIEDAKSSGKITDSNGIKYPIVENGIVFLQDDLLEHVTSTSDGKGYEENSVSFSSDDYFFLLVEYYVPDTKTVGKDYDGKTLPGTHGGTAIQYAVARRGSEFGSGFTSDKIDNGDMLCWTDVNGKLDFEFDYLSRTDTGDNTRGEPTFTKLTEKDNEKLKKYLNETCGIKDEAVLTKQVKYWLGVQANDAVKAALNAAKGGAEGELTKEQFEEYFKFAVSARPGGIRSGDMANNHQSKSKNTTGTAYNYYLPTVSDHSGTNNSVIINNYLGNNGLLKIANSMLLVTKLLEAPEGFKLSESQKEQSFLYQVFIQGLTGTQKATLVQYNELSGTWQRKLAYIDILTDNSDLVLDKDNHRAVFVQEDGKAKLVVQGGEGKYYYADENGKATTERTNTSTLYYLYLPHNNGDDQTRRLYQDEDYTGADNVTDLSNNNSTEYTKETATDDYPAGTQTYGATDAELIPVTEVTTDDWTHSTGCSGHSKLGNFTLVVNKPSGDTSANDILTPFETRTVYMTMELKFGVNAKGEALTATDLYDTIIPSGDRPDLFTNVKDLNGSGNDGDIDAAYIAQHTAEFTLKHGEGLLLTGLENRVAYRFTEKLTDTQLSAGYTLQKISHIQQRGSLTAYVPGANAFTELGYGFNDVAAGGETYFHTNAKIMESYATMTGEGNHHHPGTNPSCQEGVADEAIDESSTRHYFVKGGELVDKHYAGDGFDASRYVVNATAHFGVEDEPKDAIVTTNNARTDYTGVYSVFGNTGYFEEQAHYYNTFEPGQISVTKELKAAEGTTVNDTDKATDFSFTLEIDTEGKGVGESDGVYNYTITGGNSGRLVPHGYEKAQLNDIVAGTDGIWSFTLKGGQTMTVTGLPVDSGYTYTVTETTEDGYTESHSDNFSGTVPAGSGIPVKVTFTNTKKQPDPVSVDLKLKKEVNSVGDTFDWTDKSFTFLVEPDAGNPEGDPVVGHNKVQVTSETPVNVFENLEFKKPGTYTYTISEQLSDIPGISIDGKTYTVVVVVTEKYNGSLYTGQLEAEVKVNGAAPASPVAFTFKNTYEKDKISVPFNAKKVLVDGTLTEGQFEFELSGPNVSKTAKNDAEGNVSFGSVKFTEPGTYTYKIRELPGKDSRIKYDDTVYTVTVEITQESGSGALKSTVTYDSEVTGIPTFTNKVEGGGLTVTKTVTGDAGDTTKEFHFTVTLSDTTVNGIYGNMTFTNGVAEFTLTHGQSATATGLPAGVTYTVTEAEANADGYATSATGERGTIPTGGTAEAAFTNDKPTTPPPPPPEEPKTGGLTVTKTVTGEGDTSKAFHFTVTLGDSEINGAYGGMTFENGVAEFTLTHGQSASATGLPAGTTYTVTEAEANAEGYRTTATGDTGTIPEDGTAYAEFENSMTPGQPHKTETSPGDGQSVRVGDQISYEISWTNNEAQAATVIIRDPLDPGVDFVSAGEGGVYDAASHTVTWTLPDRPSDAAGTVTLTVKVTMRALEDDKAVANQAFVQVGNQPEVETEIPENPVKEAGNLTVTKTVTGEGDRTKEFHFTVTLSDTTVNGTYDDMAFTGGVATFTLKHGESATATGLPANITYTVTETEANLDGYTTTSEGATGTIPANGTAEAAFVNDKPTTPPPPPPEEPKTGGLTVTKTVTGEGDTSKAFHFTVTLSDSEINGAYGGMTFTGGVAEFTLTHGQSASASGLPAGTTYTVTETEANQDGYRTTVSGDSGSIPEGGTAYAEFENSMTPGQPHKTETSPGDGQSVRVGDQISYEISWTNNEAQAATVVIRDPLDPGVDFVSAGEGGVYDAASRTVTWTLPDRPSDAAGSVTLTVKVAMRALEDDKTVENQAFVQVGNQPEVETEIPENPVKETGNLTVTKTVTGDAGDTERYFTFTVTLSDETVEGTYGGMTFTGGVAQFHLKSGESRTAVGLPAGIAYTVVEAEADAEGYVTEKTGDAGTIQANDTANADFVNSKETPPPEPGEGALTVTKTVSGNAVSNMTAFHFTVTLDNAEISGTYGDMTFENGVAEFTLRHGQSRTAAGLPAGTGYTVTEAEAGTQGYRTAVTGAEGAIPDGDTAQAAFENYRHVPVEEPKPGPLAVRKLVTGEGGDTEKEFTFRVTLDTPLNGAYGEMEFVNGVATFTLRSGEVKWGREIPSGTGFTVEELEANQDGYDTIAQGTVGTIGDVRSEVRFQNHKGLWEPEDEEPWEELEDPEVPLTDLPTDEIPATGDSTRLGFWLVMLILSLTGTAITSVLLITQKRLVSLDGKHITK